MTFLFLNNIVYLRFVKHRMYQLWMEQDALKNVNNYLNGKIYSYLETFDGQRREY